MNDHSTTNRRDFLKTTGLVVAGVSAGIATNSFAQTPKKAKFKMCLNPGIIGVNANQNELLHYAVEYGYESIISMPRQLEQFTNSELAAFLNTMNQNKISWGSTNLPLEFRADKTTFKQGLEELPKLSSVLNNVGATRMSTWIMPTHNELSYRENFKSHTKRLKECAKIVGDQGLRLGLEYVGAKTLMSRDKFSFIRTMKELRELITEINEPNVGLVLDSFHWYSAGDTEADILALTNEDVITVDINDARSDLSIDEQIDNSRELPLATGKIDLKTFLGALVTIGYDGPVRAEPFNKILNDMDNNTALEVNTKAMHAAFALVG